MKLYSQKDVDRKALKGARIAILGYGSQGRAHALNLKDSGFDVVVGVRRGGAGWKQARREGLEVAEPAQAVAGADLVAVLVPDPVQKELYNGIRKGLKAGAPDTSATARLTAKAGATPLKCCFTSTAAVAPSTSPSASPRRPQGTISRRNIPSASALGLTGWVSGTARSLIARRRQRAGVRRAGVR